MGIKVTIEEKTETNAFKDDERQPSDFKHEVMDFLLCVSEFRTSDRIEVVDVMNG